MAPDLRAVSITIYNKSGSIVLSIPSGDFYDDDTVGKVLEDSRVVALGITELSTAQGGTAAPHSNSLHNYTQSGTELNIVFYDVTPTPATLTQHGHIDTLHMRHVQHGESYSAMRGPCAEGWHVPLKSEMQNLYNTWIALGGKKTDIIPFATAFKMPIAGYRQSGSPNQAPVHENMRGYYYSCMRSGINAIGLGIILDGEGWVDNEVFVGTFHLSGGNYVRPWKDTPVTPTSSWTKLYGTSISEGGIFWNSTEGLISFSSNGSSWTTIADKNLGATTAWDGSVSYTQANAGNMYQRGNCYGFPRTGDVATTGVVDASGYGPNNYYTSSSWAIVGGGTYGWESSGNTDLRGGVTGITPAEDYREPVYYGPTHTLQSWEELIAYTDIDTLITELNKAPEEYYNKLTEENKLYTCASTIYYFCSTGGWVFVGGYLPGYDIRTKTWAKGPTSEPCPS